MRNSSIQFGLIGAGQIAQFSAKAINSHPKAKVIAVQDLNQERVEELRRKFSIPRAHETAGELFADPEVDAVYIAVPNKFHAPLAKQALEAGKHVILEKPFALNYSEAKEVVEVAEKTGKVFTLGMNQRFNKDSLKIHQLVQDGVLGEIYHAKAFWFRRSGIPKLGTWFGNKALSGGGSLYDIGVHLLDLALFTSSNFEPVSVTGSTYTKFGNRGLGEGDWGHSEREHPEFNVDDFASALVRFKNGATVTLDVSWACHAEEDNRNDVHLYGTEAGARCFPAKLFKYADKPGQYEVIENPEAQLPYSPDRFHNFVNHLLGQEALCVKPEEALVVQRILDAIAESSATGREVRLD
ncbi:Gfo/Idh/MocA family oxidoreductase [Puniceicoccales bacterium CK1056]|uniref:Gfo/Idh/MocA family oxidoreductase n=1 Tax=Oceanipulchritudo coccoides TaxID=2706888 RepID=A0A6B2LZH7_9BACT|nr:Gfo/Idh/MocA family oxidoreductase [Oceanipulchritudo coccoides]NDV60930.1 Gfo/Idh/MocA family oxidoreductase [Oceanipulchritudo coccoides]